VGRKRKEKHVGDVAHKFLLTTGTGIKIHVATNALNVPTSLKLMRRG